MEIIDGVKDEKKLVRVSGTLDAVAMYIEKEFGLDRGDANKVATILWLEQENEHAEATRTPELSADLKSLKEFGEGNTRAKGMVAQSRLFLNLDKVKIDAYKAIPMEIVNALFSTDKLFTKVVKMILVSAYAIASNSQVVPDGLLCVCMRAWNYVKMREHIPFQVTNVMSNKEFSQDEGSRLTCELTDDNGQQHLGHASWQCPYHMDGNYCTLTPEKAGDMLRALSDLDILEDCGDGSYAFN